MASSDRVPRPYRGADRAAPTGVQGGQYVAELPEDTVTVFLIGMRVNRWRKVRSWWPTFVGMPRMLRELQARPDLGLLRARSYWSGREFLTLQYWRSAEQLGRYARDPGLSHQPAWNRHNQRAAATGDVGIWHETYVVSAADIEAIYGNVPPTGLGAALGTVARLRGRRTPVHDRIGVEDPEYVDTT